MNKTNKKKLKEAAELIEKAEIIIANVKDDYYESRERNDEYYALEQIELELSESRSSLMEGFNL